MKYTKYGPIPADTDEREVAILAMHQLINEALLPSIRELQLAPCGVVIAVDRFLRLLTHSLGAMPCTCPVCEAERGLAS